MKKHTLYALLISVLLPFSLKGAFDEKNGALWHPAFTSYSFIPVDYLTEMGFLFATSGTQHYSMHECSEAKCLMHKAFPWARLGIDASFFGSELYNESVLGISMFKGGETGLGARAKLMRLGIKNYGAHILGGGDIFLTVHGRSYHFQTCFNNALAYGYRSEAEKPVSSFICFSRFYPAAWYSMNLRISFSELTGLATEIGNGLSISEHAWIGAGFDLQTRVIASHLMLSCRSMYLSYAVSAHPVLGITHTAGMLFSLRRHKRGVPDDG